MVKPHNIGIVIKVITVQCGFTIVFSINLVEFLSYFAKYKSRCHKKLNLKLLRKTKQGQKMKIIYNYPNP